MRLNRVFARFYKSFNFDHVRKAAGKVRKDWEMMGPDWYPFVEIPVDSRITAIVGANESGKSQLLGAVKLAAFSDAFSIRDLCRYCDFFGVEEDKRHWPHVGAEWGDLSVEEAGAVQAILDAARPIEWCLLFRFGMQKVSVWADEGEGPRRFDLEPDQVVKLQKMLPVTFSIDPNVALPSAVPLAWLAGDDETHFMPARRRARKDYFASLATLAGVGVSDAGAITQNAATLAPILSAMVAQSRAAAADVSEEQLGLVEDLLFKMARIDRTSFADLAVAIADEKDGYANALIEKMNSQIERGLNLRRWWVQDRDFSLRLSVREHDLVFTIRDRTGTEYTFDERSHGLRYFLSYLIQSQAARGADKPLLLLMDEPDAHLSAEAQQDLLRIFSDLVDPSDSAKTRMQVIYVTHSPFLLDKNHAERIRVLEKGRNLDGTRVIPTVAHNHYEPLRSAFGAFVGETAFVGSANLVVEGAADQILIAGAARLIRRTDPGLQKETLDLNRLVIVPSGSAGQVPYMVYLIRGRGGDRPPVVVLLDSDKAGEDAAQTMVEDPKFQTLIAKRFILKLGEIDFAVDGVIELEDLLPLDLAVAAANHCLAEVFQYRDRAAPQVTAADVEKIKPGPLFDRLEAAVKAKRGSLGKVALARAVVELAGAEPAGTEIATAVTLWLARMRKLCVRINELRQEAEARTVRNRNARLVEDRVRMFHQDHETSATREQVDDLVEAIFIQLDDSPEADAIRHLGQELRAEHRLKEDQAQPVGDFAGALEGLRALQHAPHIMKARVEAAAKVKREAKPPTAKVARTRDRRPRQEAG